MRAADDLQGEFAGPVAYDERWLWLALLGLLAVAVYYALVLLLTRRRPERPPTEDAVLAARREHLERIDRIEASVRAGRLAARDGHQQLSEAVRSYVGRVSPLPALTMALADFRVRAPRPLTDAIELMYPPEFAPDDVGGARERFDDAVRQARELVGSWR